MLGVLPRAKMGADRLAPFDDLLAGMFFASHSRVDAGVVEARRGDLVQGVAEAGVLPRLDVAAEQFGPLGGAVALVAAATAIATAALVPAAR